MPQPTMVDELSADLRTQFPDLFMGTLVWYYVPADAEVKTRDWVAAVTGTEVESMVPLKTRPVDAFKRAIAKIGKVGKVSLKVSDEMCSFKFMTRDSGKDADFVYRELVVERLGANKLSYGPVVKFKFVRSTNKMDHTVDDDVYNTIPTEVQAEINTRIDDAYSKYKVELFVLGPMKIRGLLQRQIEEVMYGIPCKPGAGLYFVFDTHLAEVEALGKVVDKLANHGVTFHTMPVPNVSNQRDMIIRAFETDTISECDRLMHQMTDTLKGKTGEKITVSVATRYAQEYATLAGRLAEYSDILEMKFEEQGNRLVLMNAQVIKMAQSIED